MESLDQSIPLPNPNSFPLQSFPAREKSMGERE
ncbi:hypothetical protein CCACVL1_07337, partial [Corchorus capsularis]